MATGLNSLAEVYRAQARNAEAESIHKQALAIREKTLGPGHPHVAQSLRNLAEVYRAQGRYTEAEALSKRALAIKEKARWRARASVQGGLWETYMAAGVKAYQQGNYPEAEKQLGAALKEAEGFGPQDPRLATSLNNLAELYRAQGRYAEAEPLHQRALAIREKALGPEHPAVGVSLSNLAALYSGQGKYADAEPLYKRSLAILEKALGSEHPRVATSLNNLALLYGAQGRYGEAEPLYKRALATHERVLGPPPRRGPEPQQPGSALPRSRPLRRGRTPPEAGAGDPGEGSRT